MEKVKLPPTIEIAGTTVKIKTVGRDSLPEDELGDWRAGRGEIRVSKDLDKDVKGQTFWHEAVHAILEGYGFSKLSEHENFVEALSQGIYQVYKQLKE